MLGATGTGAGTHPVRGYVSCGTTEDVIANSILRDGMSVADGAPLRSPVWCEENQHRLVRAVRREDDQSREFRANGPTAAKHLALVDV